MVILRAQLLFVTSHNIQRQVCRGSSMESERRQFERHCDALGTWNTGSEEEDYTKSALELPNMTTDELKHH